MNVFFNEIAIFFIKIYQRITIKKDHKCLYYPTCSNYGILAYKKYNFIEATKKTISRIRDCHPFSIRSYIDYP
jgi:putative membrane protein insertion efficiency factor